MKRILGWTCIVVTSCCFLVAEIKAIEAGLWWVIPVVAIGIGLFAWGIADIIDD